MSIGDGDENYGTCSTYLLILINLIKARGQREVKPRRDLTERVDTVEKSMGLLKSGFSSLAFLMADMMMGEKDKNGEVSDNEETEGINDGEYEEAPYTTLEKLDHVGFSTYTCYTEKIVIGFSGYGDKEVSKCQLGLYRGNHKIQTWKDAERALWRENVENRA